MAVKQFRTLNVCSHVLGRTLPLSLRGPNAPILTRVYKMPRTSKALHQKTRSGGRVLTLPPVLSSSKLRRSSDA
jgi:hypothetical protein